MSENELRKKTQFQLSFSSFSKKRKERGVKQVNFSWIEISSNDWELSEFRIIISKLFEESECREWGKDKWVLFVVLSEIIY